MNDYEIIQPNRDGHAVNQQNTGAKDLVITAMPGWIVRWGTVVLCGLFAALLFIAGSIHFPDVVNVPIHVTGLSGREGFVAEGRLPAVLANRILQNEKVIVSLEAYPYDEFGTLFGTIQRVGSATADSGAVLYIVVNNGIRTSGNKTLPRIYQGNGNAQVVTNDKTLLGRFFDKLKQ